MVPQTLSFRRRIITRRQLRHAGGCRGLGSAARRRLRARGQNPDCASLHPGYDFPSIRGRLAPRTIASLVHDPAKEEAMTSELNSSKPGADEPFASRRGFVAAAVTMAAAGAAGTAPAQTPPNLRFSNPRGLSSPPTYSHVVEVNGPHR